MTVSSQPIIGRVRHARVPQYVFGTRLPESAVPRFGSLVRTRLRALDITVYGLVYDIEVNADDAGTTRLLSIAEDVLDEELEWERNRLIPLDVSVLCVGYRDAAGTLRQALPPQPPISLDAIHICDAAELRAFHAQLDYFRLVLDARDAPADEVIAASIRYAADAMDGDRRTFILACGRELARLLSGDSARLEQILRRLQ